jgi:hypothetical protein
MFSRNIRTGKAITPIVAGSSEGIGTPAEYAMQTKAEVPIGD